MTFADYKTALVTGASTGMGAAITELLTKRGLEVHATSRNEERLKELADRTGALPHILEIDVLVNCAGVSRPGNILDSTEDMVNAIDYALETPRHVNIGMLEIMPTSQAGGSPGVVHPTTRGVKMRHHARETEAPHPRNAPESAGRYRYRNAPPRRGQGRSSAPTEQVLRALAAHKQRLGHVRARIRALTAQRSASLAQAVGSGLRISAAAGILGETVPGIRRIALAVDDPPSAELSRDEHVRALHAVRTELEAAAAAKETVERELRVLVAQAYALGFTDEAQLAALAGLPAESVRRSLRCRRRAG